MTQAAGPAPDETRTRVLSIQLSALGIASLSRLMRRHFADSETCLVDSHWWDEDREWPMRLVRRLLVLDDKWRNTWVRRRNLDLHRLRSDLGPALTARRLLARQLRRRTYDVLHFHPQSLGFASLGPMRRIPTVLHTDMTAVQLALEGAPPRWRGTFGPNVWLDGRLFRAARLVVAWSEWAAASVREDYGVEPSKVRVIYPGVDLARFPLASRQGRPGPVNLLFAGYDFQRKGGHDLLDVFLSRLADRAELHLMTTAAVKCDHPRVHLHRQVAAFSPEWHRLYEQADIFVMPTYRDSFGMVYLEAMASGLPVVAGRISAVPEIVDQGKTGFLVSPGNREELARALEALITDPPLRQRIGLAGRRVVEARFDIQAHCAALEAVFQEAARSGWEAHGG